MGKVLLLNATYEPLHILDTKRAVALLIDGRAEVVEEREAMVRSAHLSFNVPSVIRLRYFVRIPYKARLPITRRTVLNRDNHICGYCGRHGDTIDHIVPRSRGGRHEWENVVCACRKCNAKKADKLLGELGWKLLAEPRQPHGPYWLVVGLKGDPAWQPYLNYAV